MSTSSKKKEHIAVIGGGLEGCLTALFAVKAGYQVTLLEKNKELLHGASLIASRLHLGGEYPLDVQTGYDCVRGAVMWKLVMPKDKGMYTDRPPMKFTVAKATEAKGVLTLKKYLKHYEKIRKEYNKLFDQVHQAKRKDGWDRERTAQELFGMPEKGAFYRELADDELRPYRSMKLVGGIQSQEPGLNIPFYLTYVQTALEEAQKKGDLRIVRQFEIRSVRKRSDGTFDIYGAYDINVPSYHADQVVHAAWDKNPSLCLPKPKQKIRAYNRAMLLLDVLKVDQPKLSPIFMIDPDGEHGGMVSPYNMWVAIGYVPDAEAAYRGGDAELSETQPKIPSEWEHEPSGSEEHRTHKQWMEDYFKLLVKRFPIMAKAKPLGLIVRNTLNFQENLYQRRHQASEEVAGEPGRHLMYATKVTLAPQAAVEAVEAIKARSAEKQHHRYRRREPLKAILSGDYSIDGTVPINTLKERRAFQAKVSAFISAHSLPQDLGMQHYDPPPRQKKKDITPTANLPISPGSFTERISLERPEDESPPLP